MRSPDAASGCHQTLRPARYILLFVVTLVRVLVLDPLGLLGLALGHPVLPAPPVPIPSCLDSLFGHRLSPRTA
eukprot:2005713-Pyramimonas_sp.AAC.1